MDVLYILGRGSKHNDMELRLSLRCLERNAIGVDRVFIVGNKPEWVQNVNHIPAEDTYTAENNAFQKVLKACKNGISEDFVLMNDDFFLLRRTILEDYLPFIRGFLNKKNAENHYDRTLNQTKCVLDGYCKNPFNFDVHCPMVFNKHRVLLLEGIAEYFKKQETGVLLRSLYGNIFNLASDFETRLFVEDPKIHTDTWEDPNKTGCISTSDDCDNILKRIEQMYPDKSRWEK